jgi:hypothetical protein
VNISCHPCIIREAIRISKCSCNFNHGDGCRLSKAWLHLFSPSH